MQFKKQLALYRVINIFLDKYLLDMKYNLKDEKQAIQTFYISEIKKDLVFTTENLCKNHI